MVFWFLKKDILKNQTTLEKSQIFFKIAIIYSGENNMITIEKTTSFLSDWFLILMHRIIYT